MSDMADDLKEFYTVLPEGMFKGEPFKESITVVKKPPIVAKKGKKGAKGKKGKQQD